MNSRDKLISPQPSQVADTPADEVGNRVRRWDQCTIATPTTGTRVVSLNAVVADVEELLRPRFPSEVRWQTLPDLTARPIRGDHDQVAWLVARLVIAARDAMPEGGDLWVATARLTARQVAYYLQIDQPPEPWWVGLTVSDTGQRGQSQSCVSGHRPGGPAINQDEGHDYSLVQQMIRELGGQFRVTVKPGSGTTFMVCFPEVLSAPDSLREWGPTTEVPMSGGKETLLLVEDHDAVRSLATAVLTRQGYTVLAVSTGQEARELLRHHPGAIDLLVADVFLHEDSGVELAKELEEARPGLKVLIISGSVGEEDRESDPELPFEFLGKPFSPPQLMAKVRGVLDAGPSRPPNNGPRPSP